MPKPEHLNPDKYVVAIAVAWIAIGWLCMDVPTERLAAGTLVLLISIIGYKTLSQTR
jgi:hypothetical protein